MCDTMDDCRLEEWGWPREAARTGGVRCARASGVSHNGSSHMGKYDCLLEEVGLVSLSDRSHMGEDAGSTGLPARNISMGPG